MRSRLQVLMRGQESPQLPSPLVDVDAAEGLEEVLDWLLGQAHRDMFQRTG
ncbi:MAG: hypothetical protein R3B09_27515 [Nannocystaceae bacterium]